MSYNGSGLFNINTSGQPVTTGTIIDPTVFNTLMTDIASGLSTCMTKDGQQTAAANLPMGGFKLTGLAVGSSSTDSARVDNANSSICEFRMTLTTGVPVTTSDVTAATTVYVTPYRGNHIALYDGTNWHMRTSAEMSIAVPATTSTMYDLFCYDNAGTPTLEALPWTNDTTRATSLTTQDGVYVKTGVLTRRYLGSFRTTGVSGQTEDSLLKRYVWNYNNRIARTMQANSASSSWAYTTATIRQANAETTNQLDFVTGISEDMIQAEVLHAASNASGVPVWAGIGLDSTTTAITTEFGTLSTVTGNTQIRSTYRGFPGVGRHFLAWLEWSTATGTTTWLGSSTISAAIVGKTGIFGTIFG